MGEHATKQAGSTHQGASSKRPSVEMSAGDRNDFVDLLLQQAAEAAVAAKSADEKTQLQASAVALTRTRAAVAAARSQGKGTASPALLRSVDGAFSSLFELSDRFSNLDDPAMQKQAAEVGAVATALKTTFVPRGWKPPRSTPEVRARAKSADRAGSRAVTTGEKVKLARLHLGAARQRLVDGWEGINAGRVDAIGAAAAELGEAFALASDPRLMGELDTISGDLELTESLMTRLIDTVQRNHPANLSDLKLLAHRLDRILALQNKQGAWVERIQPANTSPQSAPAPAVSAAPQAADPSKTPPKDAAPPVHHGERRTFRHWIRLEDKNWENEYLGAIELDILAIVHPNGQVYIEDWYPLKQFEGRADNLKVQPQAGGKPTSHNENGVNYALVTPMLAVHTGGQTRTTELQSTVKLSGEGGEVGVQGKQGSSVPQLRERYIRRQFRVDALPTPVEQVELDSNGGPSTIRSRLVMNEVVKFRQDLEDFEVDDAEVGGGAFDTDWEIDSE